MAKYLEEGPILIHRADILDGLRALYLAQHRFDRILKEDSYACGYRDGFEDALMSLAQMVGVSDEFESAVKHLSSVKMKNLPVYTTNTE